MTLLGLVLLALLIYRLAIRPTLDLKTQLASLELQQISSSKLASNLKALEIREKTADSILSLNNIKNNSIQNNLLKFLNEVVSENGLMISSFTEPHRFDNGGSITTSYPFTIKGSYAEIEEVIYRLEQEYNFGELIHFSFQKKRDYRKRVDYLECFVILNNIESE